MPKTEYIIIKRCPDGSIVTIPCDNQTQVIEHLLAMHQFTTGYSLISVCLVKD